jgi:uncharacterized DUF497 family protein
MVWFEWDDVKANTNERKHGVHFDDAMLVFSDPYALVEQDRIEGGELRWQTFGWRRCVAACGTHGPQPGRG